MHTTRTRPYVESPSRPEPGSRWTLHYRQSHPGTRPTTGYWYLSASVHETATAVRS